MTNKKSPIFFGRPVQFKDRWNGRLSGLELAAEWEVLNLFVSSGLFKPVTVKLPASAATWDEEHIAFSEVTSRQAFRREVPPTAAAARPITAATPVVLDGARLAGLMVEVSSRNVVEILVSRSGGIFRLGVSQVSFLGPEMRLSAQTETLTPYRGDSALIAIATGALARTRQLTADERLAIMVTAAEGAVQLTGNVLTPRTREVAVQVVTHAVSPAPLSENIVDDLGLEFAVSRALLQAGAGRHAGVHPRSRLGAITLYGYAGSAAGAAEAERITAQVGGVRSVQSRIETPGRPTTAAA